MLGRLKPSVLDKLVATVATAWAALTLSDVLGIVAGVFGVIAPDVAVRKIVLMK